VGPFLLIHLLLQNHLKKSDDARVLNASSNIIKHFFSPKKEIDFDNLQGITDSKLQTQRLYLLPQFKNGFFDAHVQNGQRFYRNRN
jgi:hypothetical protein